MPKYDNNQKIINHVFEKQEEKEKQERLDDLLDAFIDMKERGELSLSDDEILNAMQESYEIQK